MLKEIKTLIRKVSGIRGDTNYFSQAGEDAIVWKIASSVLKIEKGTYVDIGAYHPVKHSNTFLLYKAGWRGFNIDPRPGMKKLFDYYRPEDVNIESGIAEENSEMTYYVLEDDSTMNSFSKDNLERLGVADKITKSLKLSVYRLDDLLDQYTELKEIDYLNIDAEGFEMEILNTVNYKKHDPKIISIEQNGIFTLNDVLRSGVCRFLESKLYVPVAKNILLHDIWTVFYVNSKYIPKEN